MDFVEIIKRARNILKSEGRMTYRTLKRQFELDDEALEDLKFELIEGQEVAADKDGKMLVWTGGEGMGESGNWRSEESRESEESGNWRGGEPETTRPPVSYTPVHLADRIRAVAVTDGERKTITALFADLKGSTALIEGLDPEEARTVIDPALQRMMDAVHQYDGFVAQALGDGIFALFGAPLAHEDHPQRAVYAALRMQDTMRRYSDTLRQQGYPPLLMRVGVNTGEVVLRSIRKDDLHADYVPVGHSTNLAARIDRLTPEEKALLQQLAVIGRQFPLSLVRQVIAQPEADLYRLLASLQHKEFLYEQPAFPESEYIFKHALTQEVAYGTVLQEQKKPLHERTGQALEQLFHDRLEEHYEELAHHYKRSENAQKAVDYLKLAGQQTLKRSANIEAIAHLTTAIELLETLPNTLEHARQELGLRVILGPALIAAKGWATPEVEKNYTRAQELCRQVGKTPQLFPVLFGLWSFYHVRGEHHTAQELGEQLLNLAQNAQDQALQVQARMALGATLYCLGEFTAARKHAEQGTALYDLQQHRTLAFLYGGTDPGMAGLTQAAWTLWMLGYPTQALQRNHKALSLAHELAHPHSLAFALNFSAELHQFRREVQDSQEQAEAAITISAEDGFPYWLAWGTILRGWALTEQGLGTEGIVQIRSGLSDYWATGAELRRPHFFTLLAGAYKKAGRIEEGLRTLAEAKTLINETGECYWEAEVWRLKGELLLAQAKKLREKGIGKLSD